MDKKFQEAWGPTFFLKSCYFPLFQIDDPLDAIPVHGAGGIWGTLAVHLFKWEGIFLSGSSEAAWGFLFNIIGLLAIITWTGTLSFLMFYGLKKVKMLRVEAAAEFKGNLKPLQALQLCSIFFY